MKNDMKKILNFSSRKSIFLSLIIGKLLMLPILILLFNYFDSRPDSLFLLPDMVRYEDAANIQNFFNLDSIFDLKLDSYNSDWVSNVGYMSIVFFVKKFISIDNLRIFILSLISLITISLSQSIILQIIFRERKLSKSKFKLVSILISILNFYVLIYSFKTSTDVFGCLGIAILIDAYIKSKNLKFNKYFFVKWFLSFLFLCLFRNNLILFLPFLLLTEISSQIFKEISLLNNVHKFFVLVSIGFFLILNYSQIAGNLEMYLFQQKWYGLKNINIPSHDYFSLDYFFKLAKFFASKLIFLLGAREAVGMSSNWFANTSAGISFSKNVVLTNIIPAIILININFFGIISIFKSFSRKFINSFIFSLIPLIPILSFASHHRYFLPYAIVTSGCLPFLFEKKIKI